MSAPRYESALCITRFVKKNGPLTKTISLASDGTVKSDGSACLMSAGIACRVQLSNIHEFAGVINRMTTAEAIALGSLRSNIPDEAQVVCKHKLQELNGATRPDVIARTGRYITYQFTQHSLALLDFDRKGMTADVAAQIDGFGGLWQALVAALPQLAAVARVTRQSTSAGLFRADSGEPLPGSGGMHIYVLVKDGTDIERFLKTLHERCWLAGLGWLMVGAAGQLLERSIVDRMVGAPERLVFEADPILISPVAQDKTSRDPLVIEGATLDTIAACPPLTILQQAKLSESRAKEAHRLAPDIAKAREAFVDQQCRRLTDRPGIDPNRARRIIERQCDGILLPDIALPFDDEEFFGNTVRGVLADPAKFEGATLADPLEGAEYGRCKARIMRRADGAPWIHSFAHGRTVYELKLDASAAQAALQKAPKDEVPDTFVRLVLASDLNVDEIEALRNLASDRSGITRTTLGRKLKNAQQAANARLAQEERDRRIAERQDPRPRLSVPPSDSEWDPTMQALNDVLGASQANEPPMRNSDELVADVRGRRVLSLHALTSEEVNDDAGH